MNPYKKINTYLLENHPLLWHSRAFQLLSVSLIGWLISYIIGYNSIDLSVLNRRSILELYFTNFYILFHIIFVLSTVVFWAIYFFKNNAFKNYYPIQKGYFTKLFGLLFIPFFFLVSFYIPYTAGAKSKTATFSSPEEIKADINKLNLAYPFLIQNPSDYNIENRAFPKPFPLEIIKFDKNTKNWNNSNLKIHTSKGVIPFQADNYKDYQIEIEGQNMIFYSTHEEYISKNKCNSQQVIYKLYKASEFENLYNNSIYNFSNILVQPHNYHDNVMQIESYEANLNNFSHGSEYKSNYASKVVDLVKLKKYSVIQNSIDDFEKVCQKYQIDHNLNSKHIIRYLSFKNFRNFKKSITKTYKDTYNYYNPEDEINQIESVLKHKKETIKYMSSQHVYFYDSNGIDHIFQNFKNLEFPLFSNYIGLLFLFIALGLTWLFICFEFTQVKGFLIAIPIAGVISVINSIIIMNLPNNYDSFSLTLSVFIISILLIFTTLIIGLYTKKMSKKILTLLLNLYYLISPFIIILLILLYNELTRHYSVYSKCHGTQIHSKDSIFINPYWLFVFSVIGILSFFPLLKKWKAYEE